MKYTAEQTKEMIEAYNAGTTVDDLAAQYNVPKKSIIAKLSSTGVYKKQVYLTKRGEVPKSKEALIEELAGLLGVELDRLESLEKVNKSVLNILIQSTK